MSRLVGTIWSPCQAMQKDSQARCYCTRENHRHEDDKWPEAQDSQLHYMYHDETTSRLGQPGGTLGYSYLVRHKEDFVNSPRCYATSPSSVGNQLLYTVVLSASLRWQRMWHNVCMSPCSQSLIALRKLLNNETTGFSGLPRRSGISSLQFILSFSHTEHKNSHWRDQDNHGTRFNETCQHDTICLEAHRRET